MRKALTLLGAMQPSVPPTSLKLRRLRGWLPLGLDRWQWLTVDLCLKTAQPLIDRDQFDDRAPRVDEILKRGSHLCERVEDLVHRAEGDLARDDRGREQDVRKDDVCLQIDDPADIEVHEVQIEPEVIPANVAKEHA